MTRAAAMKGLCLFTVAIASANVQPDLEITSPSSAHLVQFDDSCAFVHTSLEIALEVEKEWHAEQERSQWKEHIPSVWGGAPTPAGIEVFTYRGCYKNEGVHRIGVHIDNKSWDWCASEALVQGKHFFGVEYPQAAPIEGEAECVLLDGAPSMAGTTDAECEVESFNGNRLGGANRLAVYSSLPIVPTPAPTLPPTMAFRYHGCFKNEGVHRIPDHFDDKTWDWCAVEATVQGKQFFGLEYPKGSQIEGAAECVLLDGDPEMDEMSDSECETESFNGNRLGGGNRLAVYTSLPPTPPPTLPPTMAFRYRGCFKNLGVHRIPDHFDDKTWDWCAAEATVQGKQFFGLEYPKGSQIEGEAECVLLDGDPEMDEMSDSECETEWFNGNRLGGGNRLAVYTSLPPTPAPTMPPTMAFTYRGCFKNLGVHRIPDHFDDKTWDWCAAEATVQGKQFFGLEYPKGSQIEGEAECVLLDGDPEMDEMPDSECETEWFNGNRLGGGNRLAVYSSAPPTPAPPPSCCRMHFNSPSFAKCDFWGDPHWTQSFGHGRFDMQGRGAFQVAASLDGEFEVQDVQCPFANRQIPQIAVGIAIKVGGTRIVVHQNFVYVNGTKVTASTAGLLDGLNVAGDTRRGGVMVESDDCCYRASVSVRTGHWSPGFFHNVQIRVLDRLAADTGVCGVGPSYDTIVGSRDLLFDPAPLQDVCKFCTEKPPQCTGTVGSPQPTPIPSPAEMTPQALCAQVASQGHCGVDPLAQAQRACAELNGTDHKDGCMIDYCETGCEQEIVDSAVEERKRTPPDTIEEVGRPTIPEDNDPGCATVSPTGAPTPVLRDRTPVPTPAACFCPAIYSPVCGENGQTFGNSCEAGCARVTVDCAGPCPCTEPSATGDPHVNNLAGERFDINQPADHLLLRVPLDQSRPALLELRGQIMAEGLDDACAMYIRMMTLHGKWLGDSIVQVRTLRRNMAGPNSAGNETTWPFSIRQSNASAEGSWMSMAEFGTSSDDVQALSAHVHVAAHALVEEFGSGAERQAFEFLVGRHAQSQASITVLQGRHQSLNLQLKNTKSLGTSRLGGLLGTEKHSRQVEELTQECKASRASTSQILNGRVNSEKVIASRISISW